MAGNSRNLSVNLTGDTSDLERALLRAEGELGGFDASVKKAQRSVSSLEREIAKGQNSLAKAERDMSAAMEKQRQQQLKSADAVSQSGSAIGSLVAGAALVAPAAAAAGTAILAFGAIAAPSIIKVVKAQTNMAGTWDTLDQRQKVAAVGVQQLTNDYKSLAKSYEPQSLQVFNGYVATGRQLMGQLTPLIHSGATAFGDLSSQLEGMLTGGSFSRLFDMMAKQAIPDTKLLGNVVTNTGNATANMLTDLAPIGQTVLAGAGGLTKLVAEMTQASPTAVQLGVSMVALQKPATAIAGRLGKSALATKLFGESASKVAPVLGTLLVVGGALALKLGSMQGGYEKMAAAVLANNNAVGNNVAGYKAASAELSTLAKQHTATVTAYNNFGVAVNKTTTSDNAFSRALDQNNKSLHNVQSGAQQLASSMGITRTQALALANAAGVDLSTSVDRSGKLTANAATKIAQYKAQVQAARNPTSIIAQDMATLGNNALDAKTRIGGLTDALNRYFTPAIAAYQDTTALAGAQNDLAKKLKASHGQMGTQTQKMRDSRDAFASYIKNVAQSAQDQSQLAIQTGHGNQAASKFKGTITAALPKLYSYAGNNKSARKQVDALAKSAGYGAGQVAAIDRVIVRDTKHGDSMAKTMRDVERAIRALKSRTVYADVQGGWSIYRGSGGHGSGHYATGGPIYGPGTGTSDSVPIMASRGEYMMTASAHQTYGSAAMDAINAGQARIGYAEGGPIGSLPAAVGKGYDSDVSAIVKQLMKELMASGAGAGSGVQRWAPLVLQVLGMLGQSASWLGTVLARMNQESGGNPNAINRWDSNAKAGHPSQGLMQTIPGTFSAYAGSFRSLGILNPLANIYAGLNYALHRYGSLAALSRPGGYADGTDSATPGWHVVGERGPELIHARGGERIVSNAVASRTPIAGGLTRGGDGATVPTVINIHHVPGYSVPSDVKNALGVLNRQTRLARS